MRSLYVVLALAAVVVRGQDDFEFAGPEINNFKCPEKNGLFPDSEQCDLYYECVNSQATPRLCDDGLVFDISKPNHYACVLPHNIDCGDRVFVQEPRTDVDVGCKRANGLFPHPDEAICDKFYLCDKGSHHEIACAAPLVFDEEVGSCVRPEDLTPGNRVCNDLEELPTVEGFQCEGPNVKVIGPQGLIQQHPTYPHPSDCQFFFTCFHGRTPMKLGCSKGQAFDAVSLTCKAVEDVPECGCWYECPANSPCKDSCNADCSCPADAK